MRARWQVRQQAEVFNATRGHPRVLTLRMEELESGFDPAVTRLLRFLLSGSEMPRNVSGAWAAQATPLPLHIIFSNERSKGGFKDGSRDAGTD